ncbi:MAG: Mur ligase family protein [Eubacteriales bacterium]
MLLLDDLINELDIIQSWNKVNIMITGIAYHSKRVNPGNIFVCIKGYKSDGHTYIPQVIDKGAVAIIVEEYQDDVDIPQFLVKDSRHTLAALSDAFYGHPSKNMKVIGITATNGKTTTSFMIDKLLSAHGLETGLIGTVMIKFGDHAVPAILTTPESLDLQSYLYEMKEQQISHVTMEVSSSALQLKRVDGVDFDIVTLNNISREHIDLHGTFDDYYNSKAALIRNAPAGKWAILNLDCPYSASLAEQTKAHVFTFGVENNRGDLCINHLDLSTGRAQFTVELQNKIILGNHAYNPCQFPIKLSVPGYHSVYNSLVAIAVGILNGIPKKTIQKALNEFAGVERRFQFIFEDDFKIIDDHFANTGNIDVTLETLNFMKYNHLHLVYAIRGSRGVTTNRENAEAIVKWASKLGLTELIATLSKNDVTEKDKVTEDELAVFQKVMDKAGITVHLYEDLSQAIFQALHNIESNDIMLLAGCQGMDHGAQITLEQIHQLRPHIDKNSLFEPLENRVAGII